MTPTGFATFLAVFSSIRNQESAKHANEHQDNDHGTGEEKDDTQAESELEPGINDMGCH